MASLVDTNVLVYRFDGRFPEKQRVATELLRAGAAEGTIYLPHQAIVEFVAAVTRPIGGSKRRGNPLTWRATTWEASAWRVPGARASPRSEGVRATTHVAQDPKRRRLAWQSPGREGPLVPTGCYLWALGRNGGAILSPRSSPHFDLRPARPQRRSGPGLAPGRACESGGHRQIRPPADGR